MVGSYEPYVDVCARLAELSPCRGREQKSLLLNSGTEAIENAVKIARHATGRPGVVVFERGFHGRTLLSLTMTEKVVYRSGFGPFAPEVYRAAAPYVYRGVSSDDAIASLERLFKADVDPASVACAVLEPVQGEGGFIPMPLDFPAKLRALLDEHGILYVDDEVQSGVGRTGAIWAIEHYGVEPDLLVAGKSLGGGLPLASVTGRAELMDSLPPVGSAAPSAATPRPVLRRTRPSTSCPGCFRAPTRSSDRARPAWSGLRPQTPTCADSARCSGSSLPSEPRTLRERGRRRGAGTRSRPPLVRPLRQRRAAARAVRDRR